MGLYSPHNRMWLDDKMPIIKLLQHVVGSVKSNSNVKDYVEYRDRRSAIDLGNTRAR